MKKRTCGDSPGLVTACPLTPRLYGRARCGVSEAGQVPVLSCIVEEEPTVEDSQLANSITNRMTSHVGLGNEPVSSLIRFVHPDVPSDGGGGSHQRGTVDGGCCRYSDVFGCPFGFDGPSGRGPLKDPL